MKYESTKPKQKSGLLMNDEEQNIAETSYGRFNIAVVLCRLKTEHFES